MNTEKPVVSVIVPYVNHKDYIGPCWEHLARQTFTAFEVIFVDNGSTDGAPSLVDELTQAHPGKVIGIREEKKGIPFARNAGLRAARGRYVSFLDVDDRFVPDKLRVLVKLMDAHPDAAMAYGQTMRVYSSTGKNVIQDTGKASPGINLPPDLAIDWATSFYRLPQTGATLIRKEKALKIGGFPENLLMGNDDTAFHIRIAMRSKIVYHPFVAIEYFRHESSEGARLNNTDSVHQRYFNAYAEGIEPLGKTYFEKTGDIRLWGIAQRGMFVNYVNSDMRQSVNGKEPGFWNYYRIMVKAYRFLPSGIAKFIYKATRRIPSAFFPDRYPLR